MTAYRLQPRAIAALDDIFDYSRARWGDRQADSYLGGFFECFQDIAARRVTWRTMPADLGIEGFRHRHKRHLIYWRIGDDGAVIFFAILHERMHQAQQLDVAIGPEDRGPL